MRFQILKDKRQGSPPPLIPQHQDHVWKFLYSLNLLERKYGTPGPVWSLPLEVWAGIFGIEQPRSGPWVSPGAATETSPFPNPFVPEICGTGVAGKFAAAKISI